MINRIIGILKLDVNTFEEIEHDEAATAEAAIIVAVVAVLSAISGFFGAQASNNTFQQLSQQFEGDIPLEMMAISPIGGAFAAFIGVFITWILWSALTYVIGTNLFKGQATMGEMLRVLGYAQVPRLLNIFSFIPCLGAIVALVALVWSLVVGFIAVRQGLDIDNTQTAITVVLSFLVAVVVNLCFIGPIFSLIL